MIIKAIVNLLLRASRLRVAPTLRFLVRGPCRPAARLIDLRAWSLPYALTKINSQTHTHHSHSLRFSLTHSK